MLPSLRLVILVIAAAPLFLVGSIYDGFVGIGVLYVSFLLIYLTLDALLLPRRSEIEVKRVLSERISLGYPTLARFEVTNRCRRPMNVFIADELLETMTAEPEICECVCQAGETKTLEYRITARERGRYELPSLNVRVLPLMGLLYRQFKITCSGELQVFPNLMNLKRFELLTRRGASLTEGLARIKRTGAGSEFESLRHYIPGDEMSRIEWKATAKRSRLIVKNYEPEQQQSVLVAIDVGRATAGEFEGLSRLDYMVDAALMLAYTALRQRDYFSLLAFSDRIERYLPPINGLKNVDRVARALFDLKSRLVESDYGAACRFLSLRNRKRSLLCLMTDIIDAEANSIILAYMARFARYHLPIAVTLSNPEIEEVAHEPLVGCKDIHSKAVALDVLTAREQALAMMRQSGVSVLDVPPNALTPSLITRYTKIKASRQL